MRNDPQPGVGGTVDAFNFIRRLGFPTTPKVAAMLTAIVLVATVVSLVSVGLGLAAGILFGLAVLVVPAMLANLLASRVVLRGDKILDFRRLLGLEIVAMLPLAIILPVSSIIGLLAGLKNLWIDGFLIGLTVSLPARFMTPMAMSSQSTSRKMAEAIIAPILITEAFLGLTPMIIPSFDLSPIISRVYLLVSSGLLVSAVGVSLIIKKVEKEGTAEIHHSPMGLFRAFLDHWLRSKPSLLEERLLNLSTEGSIETRILSFSGLESKPQASIIVSNFHPGPYRDMGSGGLPSELKQAIEASKGGIVQVPHGISNHKLNIVSHRDVERLLNTATDSYPSQHTIRQASLMVREREGEASVSGQAFGNVALLTITLAPDEMEDLPTDVSTEIDKRSATCGFQAVVADAHNSIKAQTSITPAQAGRIIAAATKVLSRLANLSQGSFKVGAADDDLRPFTLKDGIGPGGLAVMAVKTGGQTVAYVTIDGNNMQQGLRENILKALQETGVQDSEVMTTDTHLVTGLVRSPLGYYPVGQHLPSMVFIPRIVETVRRAMAKMEDSSAELSKFSLQMQVLGSDTFQSITGFTGRVARQIGRRFYWLEISTLVLALSVLFVAW